MPTPALRLEFASDPHDLAWHEQVQDAFAAIALEVGIHGLEAILLPTAIVEAINNIIEHAYQSTSGEPILVEAEHDALALSVLLRDRGAPMPMPLPSGALPETSAEGGRGWRIIRAVFPEVHYQRIAGENLLRLVRPLSNQHEPGQNEPDRSRLSQPRPSGAKKPE